MRCAHTPADDESFFATVAEKPRTPNAKCVGEVSTASAGICVSLGKSGSLSPKHLSSKLPAMQRANSYRIVSRMATIRLMSERRAAFGREISSSRQRKVRAKANSERADFRKKIRPISPTPQLGRELARREENLRRDQVKRRMTKRMRSFVLQTSSFRKRRA